FAEQRDLSLEDVFHLVKNYECQNQQPDVKPVLLNIKQEDDQRLSDGEHYLDNTYSDSDGEVYETIKTGKIEPVTSLREQNDETKAEENIHSLVPFMAETILEPTAISSAPKLFECYLCHKTWKTAGNLTYHFISYHTIGKTSKCHLCGKWIRDASNMVRHLNVHFSTKQYQCHICDFSFARSTSLKNHLLSHSQPNQKTFDCSSCSKTFISKQHLKIHKKT
ncbi:Zinc finger protein, partial [Pseudolycoriella hygida]